MFVVLAVYQTRKADFRGWLRTFEARTNNRFDLRKGILSDSTCMVKYIAAIKSELELVERVRKRALMPPGAGLVLGIGDDCAIFRPRGAAEDLLFTTDMLIEDSHFGRASHRPEDLGLSLIHI